MLQGYITGTVMIMWLSPSGSETTRQIISKQTT